MNRSKLGATGLLLAVFAVGFITGTAVNALAENSEDGERERPRRSYTEHLQRELDLRENQTEGVRNALEIRQESMRALWEETAERYANIRQETRADIMVLLDSAQAETYQAMITRSDSIRAEKEARKHRQR